MTTDQIEEALERCEWRAVKGFEGYYEVSNQGEVRSLTREVGHTSGSIIVEGRMMTPSPDRKGYQIVNLSQNRKAKYCKVHRLVAIAFLPKRHGANQVNHIDGNKANNRLENLEWCTAKENMQHRIHVLGIPANHGKYENVVRGEQNGRCKYTDDQIEKVRELRRRGLTYATISAQTGISESYCSMLGRGMFRTPLPSPEKDNG